MPSSRAPSGSEAKESRPAAVGDGTARLAAHEKSKEKPPRCEPLAEKEKKKPRVNVCERHREGRGRA